MKLIRNIIVTYGSRVDEFEPFDCNLEVGGYTSSIKSLSIWDDDPPIEVLLSGIIKLDDHPKVKEGVIQIPEEPRKILESYLEYIANTKALVSSARRKLFSPLPTVAFVPENEGDEKFLSDNTFPDQLNQKSQMVANPELEMDKKLINELTDRGDGVMLIAEALSCSHATGAFHEYMRLFERAFKKANRDLIDPLQEFLNKSKYNVKPKEAKNWISDFRHPSIHADERDYFHIESDIRPIIGRVKQAAFDVLLNKENWRSDDTERRSFWDPEGFINDSEGESLTVEYEGNSTMSVNFEWPITFDLFEAYPLHEKGKIMTPPEEWVF
jgi:hypothetical protein